ncbi:hypothetical protein M422DRAFT_22914 [Sphaerobolus stellatus SS14]|nr:hypothetical protein M422DRAFT_22914 [Sphaerobolus stellatus SS14]
MLVVQQLLAILSLVLSVIAITVTQPSEDTTWSANGPNQVSWQLVSTDPTNFGVVLTQNGLFIQNLAGNVDGTKGSITITASVPTGGSYRVNIVKDLQDVNTILAQSPQFDISSSGSSGAGSSGSSSSTQSGQVTVTVTPSSTTPPSATKSTASSASNSVPSTTTVTAGQNGASTTGSGGSGSGVVQSTSQIISLQPTGNSAVTVPRNVGGLIGILTLFGVAFA